VTGTNPLRHQGRELPVENVSWWDAVRYCNARSRRESLQPCYDLETGACDLSRTGYRLPTEAEWLAAAADHASSSGAGTAKFARLGAREVTRTDALLAREKEGTAPVAGLAPNRFGLYDIIGNVWEWCQDVFDPVRTLPPVLNLSAADKGRARVIRGGSYLTAPSWAKGYRSSLPPNARSPYTGFRVCRTEAVPPATPAPPSNSWVDLYQQPPAGYESSTGTLTNLLQPAAGRIETAAEWQRERTRLRQKWNGLLGTCAPAPAAPRLRVLRRTEQSGYTATLADLELEPGVVERIYVMQPDRPVRSPMPVVIVPFYDVDAPAAEDLGGRNYASPGVRSFALLAVQQGYLAVAVRWFAEGDGESYAEAVANLATKHPGCTGLGKWVSDARALVNYLYSRPDVDRERIAIIGHSLGAKMSLYAAAFDDRIRISVASEPGIGFKQSNYDAYWYFGEALSRLPPGTDQHELIAMLAPRPFLLIGGDQYDTAESWYYINAARPVYALFDAVSRLGYLNHHTGHSPTPEAAFRAVEWIRHFFEEPRR
jgi:dienelactone hydrolase